MTHDDHRVVPFLSGDLPAPQAEEFEAHLVTCDGCWLAVTQDRRGRALAESLRELAPTALRDRVRMQAAAAALAPGAAPPRQRAVSVAALLSGPARTRPRTLSATTSAPRPARRRRRPPAAARPSGPAPRRRRAPAVGALVAAVLLLGGAAWAARGGRPPETAVAAVVRAAHEASPPPSVVSDGQVVVMTRSSLEGRPVTVARSSGSFPMPAGGRQLGSDPASPWVAEEGSLTVVCLSQPENLLLVGDLPAERLIAWAQAGRPEGAAAG